jgi:hypothetical protein
MVIIWAATLSPIWGNWPYPFQHFIPLGASKEGERWGPDLVGLLGEGNGEVFSPGRLAHYEED